MSPEDNHCMTKKKILLRVDDYGREHDRFLSLLRVTETHAAALNVGAIPALYAAVPRPRFTLKHCFFQHGFAHMNHAASSAPKSEFPAERSLEARAQDITAGLQLLADVEGFFPAFCAPWNRLRPGLTAHLASLGHRWLLGGSLPEDHAPLRFLPYCFDLHTSRQARHAPAELAQQILGSPRALVTLMLHHTFMDERALRELDELLSLISGSAHYVTLDEL